MKAFCIACKFDHEHYAWRSTNEGWYCVGFGTNRQTVREINLTDARLEKEGHDFKHPDMLQPAREGVVSREYRDHYGKDNLKRWGFSDKAIDNAKDVWK